MEEFKNKKVFHKENCIFLNFNNLFYCSLQQKATYLIKNEDEDYECERSKTLDLKELKRKRILEKKLNSILHEISIFIIFLFFLNFVSFSNVSNTSFIYNQLFQTAFVNQQNLNEIGLNDVI